MADVAVVRAKVKVPELHKSKVHIPKYEDALQDLATRAKNKLGYGTLHEVVNGSVELARTLRRLHIRIFKPELVEKYKEAKLRQQVVALHRKGQKYIRLAWNTYTLNEYEKPVPEFVLNKALQIKDELPAVRFEVEELSERAPDPDPFMVASLDKERYYFEVWEEPKFEAKVLAGTAYFKSDEDEDSSYDGDEASEEEDKPVERGSKRGRKYAN